MLIKKGISLLKNELSSKSLRILERRKNETRNERIKRRQVKNVVIVRPPLKVPAHQHRMQLRWLASKINRHSPTKTILKMRLAVIFWCLKMPLPLHLTFEQAITCILSKKLAHWCLKISSTNRKKRRKKIYWSKNLRKIFSWVAIKDRGGREHQNLYILLTSANYRLRKLWMSNKSVNRR